MKHVVVTWKFNLNLVFTQSTEIRIRSSEKFTWRCTTMSSMPVATWKSFRACTFRANVSLAELIRKWIKREHFWHLTWPKAQRSEKMIKNIFCLYRTFATYRNCCDSSLSDARTGGFRWRRRRRLWCWIKIKFCYVFKFNPFQSFLWGSWEAGIDLIDGWNGELGFGKVEKLMFWRRNLLFPGYLEGSSVLNSSLIRLSIHYSPKTGIFSVKTSFRCQILKIWQSILSYFGQKPETLGRNWADWQPIQLLTTLFFVNTRNSLLWVETFLII